MSEGDKISVDIDGLARAVSERVTRKMAHEVVQKLEIEIQVAIQRQVSKYIDEHVMPEVASALEGRHSELVEAAVTGVKDAVAKRDSIPVDERLRGYHVDASFDGLLVAIGGKRQ
jgi:hypothetical protein